MASDTVKNGERPVKNGERIYPTCTSGQTSIACEGPSYSTRTQPARTNWMTHRAEALNARGVRTARGGRWYGQTVKNVLRRAGEVPRHPRSGANGVWNRNVCVVASARWRN